MEWKNYTNIYTMHKKLDEVKTKLREIYKNYDLDYDDSNDLNKL